MKKLLALLLMLATVGVTAWAGVKLKSNSSGDLHQPDGSPDPHGGTWRTFGTDTLYVDPIHGDQFGADPYYWNAACGCYRNVPDEDVRWIIECVGQDPEGNCICWSYEVWMIADQPPLHWEKVDDGLMY